MNRTVSGHQHRLDRLTAIRRQRALLDHDETLLLAQISADPDPYPGDPLANDKDWVREEVAALLLLAPVTAGARLHTASRLVTRLSQTVELMGRGELPGYYATRLVEATEQLSDAHAALVETRVLPRAPLQTASQFTAAVRRAVLSVDPRTAQEKHERSRPDRKVVFNPVGDDGMVELWGLLIAEQAAELKARVHALANSWKGLDDRTPDQRRADALCSLGSETAPVTAHVNVTVALSTLLDLDDQPGDLNGDPVAAAVARAVAFDPTGRWRKLLVDSRPFAGRRWQQRPARIPWNETTTVRAGEAEQPVPYLPAARGVQRQTPPLVLVRGWAHHPPQSHRPVLPAPPCAPRRQLATDTRPRRHRRLDQPHRPRLQTTTARTTALLTNAVT